MEKVKYYPYLDTLKVSKILKDYCLVYEIDLHLRAIKYGLIWYVINSFVSNFPSIRLRYYILKFFGMNLAPNVRFYQGFHIRNPKELPLMMASLLVLEFCWMVVRA